MYSLCIPTYHFGFVTKCQFTMNYMISKQDAECVPIPMNVHPYCMHSTNDAACTGAVSRHVHFLLFNFLTTKPF